MGLIAFIILGALIGWVASRLMGRREGFLVSVLIGIVGSIIGSWISKMITGGDNSYLAFSWVGLFWSLIGAVVLVGIMNAFTKNRHHTTA